MLAAVGVVDPVVEFDGIVPVVTRRRGRKTIVASRFGRIFIVIGQRELRGKSLGGEIVLVIVCRDMHCLVVVIA